MEFTKVVHTLKVQGSCYLDGYNHWEDTYELELPLKQYTISDFWELAEAEWAKNPNSKNPNFGKITGMSVGADPVMK